MNYKDFEYISLQQLIELYHTIANNSALTINETVSASSSRFFSA